MSVTDARYLYTCSRVPRNFTLTRSIGKSGFTALTNEEFVIMLSSRLNLKIC